MDNPTGERPQDLRRLSSYQTDLQPVAGSLEANPQIVVETLGDALDEIARRNEVADQTPIEIFETAVENVKPYIEVRSKRVGGASYQVPMQVNRTRQQSLALRWILNAVREKKGRPMHLKLADELLAAYK